MNLPLTTKEFTQILTAITEAKTFNRNIKSVCKSIHNTELLTKSQERLLELESLLNTLNEYYSEYYEQWDDFCLHFM